MKQISELKARLIEKLGDNFRHGGINNLPFSPMAIIYLDKRSLEAKASIDSIFQNVWGDNRRAVVQIEMCAGTFIDLHSEKAMSVEDFLDLIDGMYATDGCFRDMSHLRIFVVQSTGDCKNIDDFWAKYSQIEIINNLVPDGLLSSAIILLDESIRNQKTAESIRNALSDKLAEDNREDNLGIGARAYNSTIILSNRLANGKLLAGERIYENYAMLGWTILLMNSIGAGYKPDDAAFYPINQKAYFTAAFSEITRPNKEICDIVLNAVLNWIDRRLLTKANTTETGDLNQLLSVSAGRVQGLDEFFQQYILKKMSTLDVFRFVPRTRPNLENFDSKMFSSVDQECLGGCSALLKQFVTFDKNFEKELEQYLGNYVRSRMSAGEREKHLTLANVQKLLVQLQVEHPSQRTRFDKYIQEELYATFLEYALPILQSVLINEQKVSTDCAKEFESIYQEFQQGYFIDKPELEQYYADLTVSILENDPGQQGNRLLNEISNESKDREAILDCLFGAIDIIFSSRSIFQAPLEQEMVSRMGQNPHDIHNQIYNMLFKNLDDLVRLKTIKAMTPQKQITIVNQVNQNGAATDLFRSIQANVTDPNMTYFNSGNSNSVRILRFYLCDPA